MAHYIAHFTKIDYSAGKFEEELIDLNQLTPAHKDILKKLFALYSQDCKCDIFFNEMHNPENMKALGCEFFNGQYWWSKKTTDLAIYKILDDMAFVLCIRQGLMAEEDTSYMEQNEKILREFLQ